ncbi:MAG: response regulator [Planctomycetaceae bacterium]
MDASLDHFQLAAQIVDSDREPLLVLDEGLRVRDANPAFFDRFRLEPAATVGRPLVELGEEPWTDPRLHELLARAAADDAEPPHEFVTDLEATSSGRRPLRLKARKLVGPVGDEHEAFVLLEFVEAGDPGGSEGRLARQALEATLLHKATAIAAETSSFEEALESCIEIVCELTDWPVGHVCLADPDDPDRILSSDIWHFREGGTDAGREPVNAFVKLRSATEGFEFGRGDDLPSRIWQSGEPAWVVNLQADPTFARGDLARQVGVRGAFGFPIKIKGDTIAVLEFFSERTMAPDRSLLAMVRSLGEQVGRVIERTRAEAALRKSEQELSELFEHAAVGLIFLSPDGVIQRANGRLLETLGYVSHEFVGLRLREFLMEKAAVEQVEECCRSGCTLTGYETRLRAQDGSARHVLLDANARLDHGRVVYLRCFARDVTDRTRDEAERARLAAIVLSSDDAIIGLSADGIVTSWNPGAERLYDYAAEEVVGGSISVVIPQEREEEMTRLLETVKRGERIDQYETTRVHRNGRRIDVSLTASPIMGGGATGERGTGGGGDGGTGCAEPRSCEASCDDVSSSASASPTQSDIARSSVPPSPRPLVPPSPPPVIGVAMIERDISERKRVAAEIRRVMQEAERANRAKGEFLANVSHELRTPMNAIIGMTELSLDEPVPDRVRDYLETAQDSAEVLLRLLNDILDFSRIEAGRFDLDEVKFNLRETLDETIRSLAVRSHDRGLEMGLDMPADMPNRLVGDPVRLRQVLGNLIGNAVKFTEAGEILVSVEPHVVRDGEAELHFRVQDTGIGISPADQERIFAPFAQVDSTTTRHHGGAGLGLSICRELVTMMGGRLWVESQVGVGTTFHFTARFGLQPEASDGAAPPHVRELKGLPVLVVDDSATNRRILEDTLKSWHMRPVVVESADDAMRKLQYAAANDHVFPLVIVDGLMPGTDGFTLVERIKTDENLAGATVLMLSSADRRLFRERCDRLDIAAYLEKPVTQSELLDTIVTALEGPPLERDAAEQAGRIGGAEVSLSILLVEDTPANRKVVTAVLSKRGHKVTIAVDGREAVDLFKRRLEFDVVLMDVQMPNMDGFQATGIIRTIEQSHGGRVPIIAMTAHAMRGDRERCLAAGMDAYLSKPIDVRRMLRLIERVALRSRRMTVDAGPSARIAATSQFADTTKSDASTASSTAVAEPGAKQASRRSADAESPPAAGQAPIARVYDRRASLERLGGDEKLFREIVQFFFEDSEKLLRSIDEGLAAGDWPSVRIASHSLKGLAAHFNAWQATEAARLVERAAFEGDTDRIPVLIGPLRSEIDRLCVALASADD